MNSIIPFERSYWVLPNKLLAGEIPSAKSGSSKLEKIQGLLDCNIDVVINLMEEIEVDYNDEIIEDYSPILIQEAAKRNRKVEVFRFAIEDLSIPTEQQMSNILDFIDDQIANSHKVYVHCWGGVGRKGTVIGCYLIRHGYAKPDNVIETINYLKRTTSISERDSPETDEQIQFVLGWKLCR
jgi:protein-tyrosine phosphatase